MATLSATYFEQFILSQVLHSSMCSNDCDSNPRSLQSWRSPPSSSAHKVQRRRLPRPHSALQPAQSDHFMSQGLVLQGLSSVSRPTQGRGFKPCNESKIIMIRVYEEYCDVRLRENGNVAHKFSCSSDLLFSFVNLSLLACTYTGQVVLVTRR